jgi:type II secretory pathway pseudopilin PulG
MAVSSRAMNKYKKTKISRGSQEQGFSILEAAIALTTLGVTLAYAMPLFLYSKMNNAKSEVRTGALMVAQRVLDDVRSTPFPNIPSTANTNVAATTDVSALGRTYIARKIHCRTADPCTANYKTLRVQVNYNGGTIYEMDAGFTNFQ